jgi:DNA-binding CsgD family transcriptional regulator
VAGVTKSDLRSVIDLLHDLASETSSEIFPRPVIVRLADLLDAENTGYCDLLATRNWEGSYIRTLAEPDWFGEVLYQWHHQDPITCGFTRFSNASYPVAASDVLSRRAVAHLDLYQHTLRPFGFADTAKLFLPAAPGEARFFFFDRRRWGLSDRDRELLALLRPHFVIHRKRWRPRSRVLDSLTSREREVLEALADGDTNAQIARKLWISRHTVRSHVEHIFEKLNVKTRTEAAARVRAAPPH